jgi:hypothetical protein
MSSKQGDRVRQSRGPTKWGCDPEAGCSAPINVAGIPYTGRSRYAGPSSYASGRPRPAGMRPSARAEGSLRSNGAPTGILLAGDAASLRHTEHENSLNWKEETA